MKGQIALPTHRLAIVGGGYIGIGLARALEADLDVRLIEPRSHFVHAPAMIRTLVDPNLLDRALVPYDRLLTKGQVMADAAVSIDAAGVTLAGGDRVEADTIVVATGSSNGIAFKPEGDDIAAFRTAQAGIHAQIKSSGRIAIVGAGAVGVELAGEIAHAMPEKQVTLVSADSHLFPGQPKKLGRALARKLGEMGVEISFGVRAEDLASLTEPSAGPLTLSDGRQVEADLVIPAIGSRPRTTLLKGLPGVKVGRTGRVAVDDWLRPSDHPNVFAAGDLADTGDAMTIVAASRQQPWLEKAMRAVAAGKPVTARKPYAPWKTAPILVPLGPYRGNSFLVIATLGDRITRIAKGRDLFIPKYRKLLGYPA